MLRFFPNRENSKILKNAKLSENEVSPQDILSPCKGCLHIYLLLFPRFWTLLFYKMVDFHFRGSESDNQ